MPDKIRFQKTGPNIGIIGAGVSGICAAIQIKKQLGIDSFTLLEQNHDVGGTWLTHTYPGCACDVPSHLYSYSFELNPNWSSNFPSHDEILTYFQSVAEKYDIHSHCQFNTLVKKLTWDESLSKWRAITESVREGSSCEENQYLFDIIFSAPGLLRIPHIPKEYLAFEGPTVHSSQWNHELQLENAKVAIIGSGASAIQIIPSIVSKVSVLHVYQRQPTYIFPQLKHRYPNFLKTLLAYFPFLMWMLRLFLFLKHHIIFYSFKPGSVVQNIGLQGFKAWQRREIPNNKELLKTLTPNFPLGCKRTLLSDDYYKAMQLPNVKLHTSHIDKINGRRIFTVDGLKEEIDILILATGYRVQDYFAPLTVIGKDGEDILESWKNEYPKMYYGITSSSMPNHFTLFGPNTVVGHSSVIFQIECQVNFAISLIKEMIRRDKRCVRVKMRTQEEYMKKLKRKIKKTVWGSFRCGSWYTNTKGEVTTQWPEDCIQYWKKTRNVDFSQFDFTNVEQHNNIFNTSKV